jgi:putative transposase
MAHTPRPTVSRPDERWTMDFISDALANGQRLRVLTVLDAYTRECLALDAAVHFHGEDVARVLTEIGMRRGLPTVINCDNGTEFTSRAGPLGLGASGPARLQPPRETDRQSFPRGPC